VPNANRVSVRIPRRPGETLRGGPGRLAKTDRLDAAMLARMGALLDLEAGPMRSPVLNDLKGPAHGPRGFWSRTGRQRRTGKEPDPRHPHNAELLSQIKRQIAGIEAEIMALIKADPELARLDILVSIPGISAITAFALIINMTELGTLGNRQAASLAGLAPLARQSDSGPAAPSSAATGPTSDRRPKCPRSSRCDSIRTSGLNTNTSSLPEIRQGGHNGHHEKMIVPANAFLRDGRKWTHPYFLDQHRYAGVRGGALGSLAQPNWLRWTVTMIRRSRSCA
jgi:transposase